MTDRDAICWAGTSYIRHSWRACVHGGAAGVSRCEEPGFRHLPCLTQVAVTTSPLAKLLESARWRAALFALLKRATRAKAVPCIPSGDSHRVVVALDRTANSKRGVPNARERVDGSHRRVDARQASHSRLPSGHLEAPPNDAYLVPVAPLPCPLCEITTHCGGAGGGGGCCGGGAFCG